jgi:uncharacterized protein YjbJ (UPF0337 family)
VAGQVFKWQKEIQMNSDVIGGNWKQLKGKVRERWARLTHDHIEMIDGKREQLVGRIQELYGITRDEVEKQIRDFEESNPDYRQCRGRPITVFARRKPIREPLVRTLSGDFS